MKNIISALRLAMDYDYEGEWKKAHAIVQEMEDALAYRVHAYLHRKEGDMDNARHWYQRMGEKPFEGNLSAECDDILRRLQTKT